MTILVLVVAFASRFLSFKVDITPCAHNLESFVRSTEAIRYDLMYTSAPWPEGKAPEKHTIQSKQGARVLGDQRELKPFGRGRWRAPVSLRVRVWVCACFRFRVSILNFVLLTSSHFPLALRQRCPVLLRRACRWLLAAILAVFHFVPFCTAAAAVLVTAPAAAEALGPPPRLYLPR